MQIGLLPVRPHVLLFGLTGDQLVLLIHLRAWFSLSSECSNGMDLFSKEFLHFRTADG